MENCKKVNLILDKNTNIIKVLETEPASNMLSVCHENMRAGLCDMCVNENKEYKTLIPGMTYCHDTLTLMGIMNIKPDVTCNDCLEFIKILNKSLNMNSINFSQLECEQREGIFTNRCFPSGIYFMESDSINVTVPYHGTEYNIYMLEEQVDKEAYDLSGYGYRETTNRRLDYIKKSPLYLDLENYVMGNMLLTTNYCDIDQRFVLNLLFNMAFTSKNLKSLELDHMIGMRDEILSLDNTWEKAKYYYLVEDKEECIDHILSTYIIHLLCHKLYDDNIKFTTLSYIDSIFDEYRFDEDLYLIETSSESRVSWYEEMHAHVLRMISLIERCHSTMINIKIDWTNRLDLQDYIERINDPDILYLESEDDGYIVSWGCPHIYFRKHLGIINKNINPERYVTPEKVHRMVCDVLTILYTNPDNFNMEHLYSLYDVYELNLILRCILYKYIKK